MAQIETQYENFVNELEENLGKVDVSLALQTLYFQSKFTDTKPKVDLRVCYRDEVDLERKRLELDKQFACVSTSYVRNYHGPKCENILRVECLADIDTIHTISKDPDVDFITGSASIASY